MEAADAPIVGLGLTGIEGTVPTEDFIPYRQEARRLGLGFEVHAGEMGPPSSIVSALDVLEADRIGHGVAAIRDEAVLDRLIRDHVVLDVCPSSNVAIGEFASLEEHPMTEFWRRGVEMTISSDDPPFFGTTLNDELRHLVRIAGLERDDLATLQRRAATHSLRAAGRARLAARRDRRVGRTRLTPDCDPAARSGSRDRMACDDATLRCCARRSATGRPGSLSDLRRGRAIDLAVSIQAGAMAPSAVRSQSAVRASPTSSAASGHTPSSSWSRVRSRVSGRASAATA